MFSFPLPYRDELLYSVIARYGVHQGIISPKELLDEVYNDRKVVATADLPSHIDKVSSLYPDRADTAPDKLIYLHTLFPLYAPFVDEIRRKNCIKLMQQQSKGGTHLTLGVAASRIQQPRWLRYCPLCIQEQKKIFGEYYWLRNWQVTGADSCMFHGTLIDSNITRHPTLKHEFIAASHRTCDQGIRQEPNKRQSILITQSVCDLLKLPPEISPSAQQWTHFYRSLLFDSGFSLGKHIDYEPLKDRVVSFWGVDWLNKYGLFPGGNDTCWLKTIFRKHRKAFSYLEHIIVWHSLLNTKWKVSDVLNNVRSQAMKPKLTTISLLDASENDRVKYRNLWIKAVKNNGINYARKRKFGYVYAWLYRHDRSWLKEVNSQFKVPKVITNSRIDWHKRDFFLVKLLCKIKDEAEYQMDDPRHSMNWYLTKLYCGATVSKHLNDLPLCKLFFEKYCENIGEYQIRRITCAVIKQNILNNELKRWQILRISGLSKPRLTTLANIFLLKVIRI